MSTSNVAQTRHLTKWLRQRAMKSPCPHEEGAVVKTAPVDNTAPVRPGQIRLLFPGVLPGADIQDRPVYVAVLKDWEEGLFLMAPYSQYTAPATTGELLTSRPGLALKVLCLWNGRVVSTNQLAQSWFVDDLTEDERSDAWGVFRHITTGADLAQHLVARIGAPIVVANDPRIQYQTEEAALVAPLMAE